MLRQLISVCLFASASTLAWCQQVPDKSIRGEPELGEIVSARSLLDREVQSPGGKSLGRVADVMLDLKKGQATLLKVTADDPSRGGSYAWDDLQGLDADSPLQFKPGSEPAKLPASTSAETTSLKKVTGTRVHNAKGEELGQIGDFAVTIKQGKLAYAAMSCTCFADAADKFYPVPLSAFVVQPAANAWLLELPIETLENMKPFPVKQWPTKIDRGWLEYVHVRYGRSPLDGVRTKTQKEKN